MNLKKLLLLLLKNRQKSPKEIDLSRISSILIRPLGYAIGDATVHTAHIQQLKSILPDIKIGVVTENNNKTIFEACGLVDEYVERNIFAYLRNYNKWDLLLDFENNFNPASLIMDFILSPKYIMIFRKYNKKYYNFNTIFNYDIHCPQADNYPLSHYISNSIFAERFNLPEPYSKLNNVEKIEKEKNVIRILLCPQGSKREIPEEELSDLLNGIDNKFLTNIRFILSYTNTAKSYYNKLISHTVYTNIALSPKTTLPEYLTLIESADLVIAVDGGSLHLACAFKKPLLSFFADSQPNLGTWQPLVYPNVPHMKVITKEPKGTNSNATEGFPLEEAKEWLNNQIGWLLKNL